MKKIVKFFFRLISFPFWAGLALIGCLYKWLYTCYCFLLYGGELAAYMRRDDKKMMNDCYMLLKKHLEDGKA